MNGRYVEGITEFKETVNRIPDNDAATYLRARILDRQYMLEPQNRHFQAPELDKIMAQFRQQGDLVEEALALGNIVILADGRQQFVSTLAQRLSSLQTCQSLLNRSSIGYHRISS